MKEGQNCGWIARPHSPDFSRIGPASVLPHPPPPLSFSSSLPLVSIVAHRSVPILFVFWIRFSLLMVSSPVYECAVFNSLYFGFRTCGHQAHSNLTARSVVLSITVPFHFEIDVDMSITEYFFRLSPTTPNQKWMAIPSTNTSTHYATPHTYGTGQ